eukprot:TRINITY_DN704_c0_g1_i1.p1 TRINITY_DN704_c0_g1~~TRINITY_DN704_c0_g1_i1.p1  ORF type:complete len:101 (-),score=40.94 TRINITY_DN704_c0_g1_i1:48-317(-)
MHHGRKLVHLLLLVFKKSLEGLERRLNGVKAGHAEGGAPDSQRSATVFEVSILEAGETVEEENFAMEIQFGGAHFDLEKFAAGVRGLTE